MKEEKSESKYGIEFDLIRLNPEMNSVIKVNKEEMEQKPNIINYNFLNEAKNILSKKKKKYFLNQEKKILIILK